MKKLSGRTRAVARAAPQTRFTRTRRAGPLADRDRGGRADVRVRLGREQAHAGRDGAPDFPGQQFGHPSGVRGSGGTGCPGAPTGRTARAAWGGRPAFPSGGARSGRPRWCCAAAARRGHRRGEPGDSGCAAGSGAVGAGVPGRRPAGLEEEEPAGRGVDAHRAKLWAMTMRVELQAELLEKGGGSGTSRGSSWGAWTGECGDEPEVSADDGVRDLGGFARFGRVRVADETRRSAGVRSPAAREAGPEDGAERRGAGAVDLDGAEGESVPRRGSPAGEGAARGQGDPGRQEPGAPPEGWRRFFAAADHRASDVAGWHAAKKGGRRAAEDVGSG